MTRILCILFLGICAHVKAQKHLDSLKLLLPQTDDLSKKAYLLDELSFQYFYENLDSSLHYGLLAYEQFAPLEDQKGLARAATSVAVAYHYLYQWDSAEYYYLKALHLREEYLISFLQALKHPKYLSNSNQYFDVWVIHDGDRRDIRKKDKLLNHTNIWTHTTALKRRST